MEREKFINADKEISKKEGGRRMAVSIREYPVLRGRNAKRFIEDKKRTENLLAKKAEQFKHDPTSVKANRRSRGICICISKKHGQNQ